MALNCNQNLFIYFFFFLINQEPPNTAIDPAQRAIDENTPASPVYGVLAFFLRFFGGLGGSGVFTVTLFELLV